MPFVSNLFLCNSWKMFATFVPLVSSNNASLVHILTVAICHLTFILTSFILMDNSISSLMLVFWYAYICNEIEKVKLLVYRYLRKICVLILLVVQLHRIIFSYFFIRIYLRNGA
jgi:hypothetical protein